ncbi:MAG: ABC transporter permease [Acidobacteriota bacterium]
MVFEIRLAWRETRPIWKRFLFLIFAVALGVGALTGLKGFSRALERSMNESSRDLIASDLAARMNSPVSPEELGVLESLVEKGAEQTRTTETLSMVSAGEDSTAILSDVRAVDPRKYPFYGRVELEPPFPLGQALSKGNAVVSRDLLVRTGAATGDQIQIGAAQFRIAAVLKSEPDRISFGIDIGPRILISRDGLDRSELIQFGSRATESFLYRLPPDLDPDEAAAELRDGMDRRIRISDYRNPNPRVSRGLQRTSNFLSLLGLLALLVGGLGISTTMYTYLQQKLDSIAILKCLGGRTNQILRIYVVQGLALGILGSLAGIGGSNAWFPAFDPETTPEGPAPAFCFPGFVFGDGIGRKLAGRVLPLGIYFPGRTHRVHCRTDPGCRAPDVAFETASPHLVAGSSPGVEKPESSGKPFRIGYGGARFGRRFRPHRLFHSDFSHLPDSAERSFGFSKYLSGRYNGAGPTGTRGVYLPLSGC